MKMYFFYGLMSSSKTAIALMKKFTFEEHGKKVLLAKPALDCRDGKTILKSRIGLEDEAITIKKDETFKEKVSDLKSYDVIITDESQFFTVKQIEELRKEMKKYDEYITNANEPEITTDTQWYDETTGEPIKESKPTSVQRVSRSKTK